MGSRLGGAWVLARSDVDTLRTVIARRIGLATTAGRVVMDEAGVSFDVSLDFAATLAAVGAAHRTLQEAFDVAQTRRPTGPRLTVPTWPAVPAALDLANPPVADAPPRAARALGVARYLDQLVENWDKLEDIRTNRSFMKATAGDAVSSDPEPKLLPFVLDGSR